MTTPSESTPTKPRADIGVTTMVGIPQVVYSPTFRPKSGEALAAWTMAAFGSLSSAVHPDAPLVDPSTL